jgi:hypothetical protein
MIKFEFDTSDLPERDRQYYHDTMISFQQGHNYDIEEVLNAFKIFLSAMTFSETLIDEIIFSRGEDVTNNTLDKNDKVGAPTEDRPDIEEIKKVLEECKSSKDKKDLPYLQALFNKKIYKDYMESKINADV